MSYRRLLVAFVLLSAASLRAQSPPPPAPLANPTREDLERGHQLFDVHCTRCHGIGGTGGMGPPLARAKLRRAPDDPSLLGVLGGGIPGTAMPAFWQLSERETTQVAAYVRSLGRRPVEALPGDPARGKTTYDGKGGCAACHIVHGVGGSQGPELSDVGDRRGSAFLRESLVEPGATLPERTVPYEPNTYAGYLVVRAVARGGAEVVGVRINEDSFTIQIRDAASRLHSLRKADLQLLEKKEGASLMPSYRATLTPTEIDDLVAYLMTLRGNP